MKQFIEVDGQQLFTADWVFQQMQAQDRRITRARRLAVWALIAGCIGVTISVIILIRL